MSQWTIAKRLIAGFSAVILVTLLLGGFAFTRLLTIDNDARRIVGDALPGVTAILQMSVNTRENRADARTISPRSAAKGASSPHRRTCRANKKAAKAYEATITLTRIGRFLPHPEEQNELRRSRERAAPLSREGKTQGLAVLKDASSRVWIGTWRHRSRGKFPSQAVVGGDRTCTPLSQSKTGISWGSPLHWPSASPSRGSSSRRQTARCAARWKS